MMKRSFSKNNVASIHEQEEDVLHKYIRAAEVYLPMIEKKGCTLKISLSWFNISKNTWSDSPIVEETSYQCFVCCEIQKAGKEVRVTSEDGEADYYSLIGGWMISEVILRFGKLHTALWPELDTDFKPDMQHLLEQLYTKHCYTADDAE